MMFWRAVVLALMPLLPLPGFAHAHAECSAHDPTGIDRAPHLHLRFFYDWALPATDQPAGPQSEDHDDDAVYFPASVVLGRGAEQTSAVVPSDTAPLPLPGTGAGIQTALVTAPTSLCLAPSRRADACPIYLRARALLI
jgi:hypothetical protein